MSDIRRREFIALLGGAAAAWPLAARAQQPERMRRVGVLMNLTSDDPEAPGRVAAFAQGLGELGWAVGRNVQQGGHGLSAIGEDDLRCERDQFCRAYLRLRSTSPAPQR
jgi:hypothetical protein